jgi:CheY-like chemotaxis protein
VKKQNPNVPVILVSGWAIQQDEPRIRDSGVDFVIQKPCPMAKFQEAVQKTLRGAGKRGNGAERERAAL